MPTILVNSQTNKDWHGVAIMAMEPIMVIWRCCWWRWNAEWWEDPVPRPTALEGLSEVGQLDTLPPYRQPLYSLPPLPSPSIQITNILLHHFKWHLHLQELSGWWMNTRPACRQPILNPQSSLTRSLDPSFGFYFSTSTSQLWTSEFLLRALLHNKYCTYTARFACRNSGENWKGGIWLISTNIRGYKTSL